MAADKYNRHKFTLLSEDHSRKPIDMQLNEMIEKGDTIINYTIMHNNKLLVEYIPYKECHLFD